MTATSFKPRATAGAPMLLPLALLLLLAPLPQPAAAKEQTLPLIANLLSVGLSGLSSLGGAPGATTGTGLRGAGPGEAQGASQSGPDLGSLFKTVFQLACPVLPISLPPFPIRADALCESTGMGQPNNQMACSIFDMLGGMISNPPLNCNPAAISMPASVDAAGKPVPQPLADRRSKGQLPKSFSTKKLLQEEGGTYGWLYKHVQRLQLWGHCGAVGKASGWVAPKGWELLDTPRISSDLRSYGLKVTAVPMAAVVKQGTHLLVLIRGTASSAEWMTDFDYNMQEDAAFGPGLLHKGFLSYAHQLWDGGLQSIVESQLAAGTITDITFSGHSSGGTLAGLLAARTQAYLQQGSTTSKGAGRKQLPSQAPLLTVVAFAASNVGDDTFAAYFNSKINARNIQYEYDITPQMPCAPKTVACPNLKVPTPNPNGYWPYARLGGLVQLTSSDMPAQPRAWQKMAVYSQSDMCQSPESMGWIAHGVHYCSYFCAFSKYLGDSDNMCLLWPAGAGEAEKASYCLRGFGADAYPHINPTMFPNPN